MNKTRLIKVVGRFNVPESEYINILVGNQIETLLFFNRKLNNIKKTNN
jgi:hypothetical protein